MDYRMITVIIRSIPVLYQTAEHTLILHGVTINNQILGIRSFKMSLVVHIIKMISPVQEEFSCTIFLAAYFLVKIFKIIAAS